MNARMANHNDVDTLIKVRFDFFAAEKLEIAEIRYYSHNTSTNMICLDMDSNKDVQ